VNAHHARIHHRLETSLEILRILSCDAPLNAEPADILPPAVNSQLPSDVETKSATSRYR
jgi:hypothetical protein